MVMFVVSLFSWWYSAGWRQVLASFDKRLMAVASAFSVKQLLKTLFAPWRRIITYPGASLAEKFHAWGDNVFSRTIGFFVRLIVLFAALLITFFVSLVTLLEVIIWPLLPFGVIGFLIAGVIW
jgi:hypothetical protein